MYLMSSASPFYRFCQRSQHKPGGNRRPVPVPFYSTAFVCSVNARLAGIDVQCQSLSIVFSYFDIDLRGISWFYGQITYLEIH